MKIFEDPWKEDISLNSYNMSTNTNGSIQFERFKDFDGKCC